MTDIYDVSEIELHLRDAAHKLFESGEFQKITISCETPWGCSISYDSSGDPESPINRYKTKREEEQRLNDALHDYQRTPVFNSGSLAKGSTTHV